MKNSLAIYIDTDYLLFAIQKNGGSQLIKNNDNCRFPMYFFVDNKNSKITYNQNYKAFYLDGHDEFIGDFFNSIKNNEKYIFKGNKKPTKELFNILLNDVKTQYFSHTGDAKATAIPSKLVFSENINANIKSLVQKHLKSQNFEIEVQNNCFSELVVKNYIYQNSLYLQDKKFVILEGLNEDLNISIVEVLENKVKEIDIKTFTQLGDAPEISTIAHEIVDDIKTSYPNASASINTEYARHKIKAEKVLTKINTTKKPQLTLSTTFATNLSKRLIANVSVSKFKELSNLQARRIFAAFNENFKIKITEFDKMFLIGNNLNGELVKAQFEDYSSGKNIYISNDISEILGELFEKPKAEIEDDTATMFLAAEPEDEQTDVFTEISTLIIDDLKIGQKIKISNYDARKGKGASMQMFEYLGNNQLKVIESSRSLKVGFIAEPVTKTWHQGIAVVLNITRKGKRVGKFKTREIRKIEIK